MWKIQLKARRPAAAYLLSGATKQVCITGVAGIAAVVFTIALYICMGIWAFCWTQALQSFASMFAAQQWYYQQSFAVDYDDCPVSAWQVRWGTLRGAWIGLRYHTGTLALGSAVIAASTVPYMILNFITSIAKAVPWPWGEETRKMCWCCIGAFDDYLQVLTKSSWLVVCLNGNGFFTAGHCAIQLKAKRTRCRTLKATGAASTRLLRRNSGLSASLTEILRGASMCASPTAVTHRLGANVSSTTARGWRRCCAPTVNMARQNTSTVSWSLS